MNTLGTEDRADRPCAMRWDEGVYLTLRVSAQPDATRPFELYQARVPPLPPSASVDVPRTRQHQAAVALPGPIGLQIRSLPRQ